MRGSHSEVIELADALESRDFELKISFRVGLRGLTLRVKDVGLLSLSAPTYVGLGECRAFVKSQSSWIFEQMRNLRPRRSLLEYLRENPSVFEAGKALRVIFMESKTSDFFVKDFERGEIVFAYRNRESFFELFMKFARESLEISVGVIASECGLQKRKISVRNQRGRWASRSTMDTLSFNWRIVLLKPEFQRYIILHEYAHEMFMDHSVSFWIHLNRLLPNAKKLDRLLSREGGEVFALER